MSILTDTDIKRLIESGDLLIKPFNEKDRLTPIGYNLSIGDFYISKRKLKKIDIKVNEEFTVGPGDTVAIRTLEDLELPKDRSLSGLMLSKVKMIKAGFSPISTTIDSDHRGHMIVIIKNISRGKAKLSQGQPFCTIVLFKNITPSEKGANNVYDDQEIVRDILNTWSSQRRDKGFKFWPIFKQFTPIIFVLISGFAAFFLLGSRAAFGGVMAIIATLAILFEKLLHK